MADIIIGAVAEGIVSKLISLAAEEAALVWGFKDSINKFQERMEMIIAFLSDVESKSAVLDSSVELWLKKLKGVVYDADAVFDTLQYEVLRRKHEPQAQLKNKVTDFYFRQKLARKIKKINLLLDDINKRASELGLQTRLGNAGNHSETDSLPCRAWGGDLANFVGRESDMSTVIQELLSSDNKEGLSVISIVGMGGLGKTTLAHKICQHEDVVGHFDKVIRVSVSDEFKETRILNQMIQFLTGTNPGLSDPNVLLEKLKGELKDKRYLLLLDDVWNEELRKWKSLRDALIKTQASVGCRIIVTTRSVNVASVMQAALTHELKGLSIADGWTMFRQIAFVEGGALETLKLVEIGKEIVERCGGVPLVINVLGSLMYSKSSGSEWLYVRENKMWASIEDINDGAFKVLKLSYDHLHPTSLKHCFAYLSILLKDSNIEKDTIVQIWMALGLLPYPKDSSTELEDVGNKYFDTLLGRSLLQEARTDDYGNIEHCRMHDLVHDLAQQTSKGYFFSSKGDSYDIPDGIVHLSLLNPTGEKMVRVCSQRLQTLVFEGPLLGLSDMLEKLKFLRVLVLIVPEMKELPKSIGKMKYLRYLDVAGTDVTELPSFLTKLYNLQTLKFPFLEKVSKMFGKLVNLRHLYGGLILVGVGKLTSLRTLPVFFVSRDEGCLIKELGDLINLRGKLEIVGLGDVESIEEAQSARLFEKSKLQSLKLNWLSEGSEKVEYVLEGLRPHSNLRSLEIKSFKGVKLSSWMMSESFSALQNLVNIKLKGCDRCEQVPSLGRLPHLKKAELKGLRNVRKIGPEFYYDSLIIEKGGKMVFFPALKELAILDMEILEESVDLKQSSDVMAFQFPVLEKLEIARCEKLLKLPNSLLQDCMSLEEIEISSCYNLQVFPDVQRLTFLRTFSMWTIWRLSDLPRGLEMLTSLKTLVISFCSSVSFVPDLDRLTTLEHLDMGPLSKEVDELPTLPSSLQTLWLHGWRKLQLSPRQHQPLFDLTSFRLWYCEELESLPDWFGNLLSLKRINIHNCKKLRSLPPQEAMSRLTKLQELCIEDCPVLTERCTRGSGTDWPKIQHIPLIMIDNETIQDTSS